MMVAHRESERASRRPKNASNCCNSSGVGGLERFLALPVSLQIRGVLWTDSIVPLFAHKPPSDKVLAPPGAGRALPDIQTLTNAVAVTPRGNRSRAARGSRPGHQGEHGIYFLAMSNVALRPLNCAR